MSGIACLAQRVLLILLLIFWRGWTWCKRFLVSGLGGGQLTLKIRKTPIITSLFLVYLNPPYFNARIFDQCFNFNINGRSANPRISLAVFQNPRTHFISPGETSQQNSLKFIQHFPLTEKKNPKSSQEITLDSFQKKK